MWHYNLFLLAGHIQHFKYAMRQGTLGILDVIRDVGNIVNLCYYLFNL